MRMCLYRDRKRWRTPLSLRRPLLLALACTLSLPARAEWSGQATLVSDYRLRGLSYSEDRPSAQVRLTYDGAGGWYGGALAASVRQDDARTLLIAYAGRAVALSADMVLDAGATLLRTPGAAQYQYAELYAGLAGERAGARLSLSPDYAGGRSAYAEFHYTWPLGDRVAIDAHAGLLAVRGAPYLHRRRRDLRLAASLALEAWTLQLAWVGVDSPSARVARGSALVASVARHF
jgi:uncharacterized protein (TIGR02001 family)